MVSKVNSAKPSHNKTDGYLRGTKQYSQALQQFSKRLNKFHGKTKAWLAQMTNKGKTA